MSQKDQLLKDRVLDCLKRLETCVRIDAPPVVIGEMAFSLFATTLAAYGEAAGGGLIRHIREQNLQDRAVCTYGDCVGTVERPPSNICPACEKEIGCDEESIRRNDEEYARLHPEECDSCDGTGLMEGWNHRDGNPCPKCKGNGTLPQPAVTDGRTEK